MRYTFESPESIKATLEDHNSQPEERKAQLKLAKILIEMITGDKLKSEQIANYKQYFTLKFDELVILTENLG